MTQKEVRLPPYDPYCTQSNHDHDRSENGASNELGRCTHCRGFGGTLHGTEMRCNRTWARLVRKIVVVVDSCPCDG